MSELSSTALDGGGSFFENDGGRPQLFLASNRLGSNDIYVSELQDDGTWGAMEFIEALNSPFDDARPSIRFDGREVIFLLGPWAGPVTPSGTDDDRPAYCL